VAPNDAGVDDATVEVAAPPPEKVLTRPKTVDKDQTINPFAKKHPKAAP
jgi:hypothetical protein